MTPPDFRFSTPVEVRFRDLDALGHVNNAVYFTYMETARVAYFKHIGLIGESYPEPFFIIAEATCQFKAPIDLNTKLFVHARVSRLGNSSFDMDYALIDAATDRVMATGRTVQVVFDYTAGRSVPLPEAWRQTLRDFDGL